MTNALYIHGDLKPDNILVNMDYQDNISDIKLVDFGSSFKHDSSMEISAATPEYLPPELLIYLEK